MDLTRNRNHVIHDARRLAEAREKAARDDLQDKARKMADRELEQAAAAQQRSVTRAREV